MAISLPWLAKRRSRPGRVGLAVGPDGLALAAVGADNQLTYCQFHELAGDSGELLAELVAAQGWENMFCSMVLHPAYYQLLLAETPPVQPEEMPSAVRWKIKELLDYPLDDAAIEHFLLPEDAYRGRQKMLYAAALRKATLQELVAPVEASGLQVDCIEIAELALHNIVSRFAVGGGGVALVQLHDAEGFINLVEDGAIYLSRRLDVGLHKFNPDADNTDFFDSLFLEIQRSLDYYESQLGKGIITQLYYSPGGPHTELIGKFLSAQLGLNVSELAFDTLNLGADEAQLEHLARCASAIGAALGPFSEAEVISAAS